MPKTATATAPNKTASIFDNYKTTVSGILEDYLLDDSGVKSVMAATEWLEGMLAGRFATLDKEIKSLKEEVDERDATIKDLTAALKESDGHWKETDEELEAARTEIKELTEALDKADDHVAHCEAEGLLVIKVENLRDQMRVEDFLKTEIFPYYSQQCATGLA